MGDRQKLSGRHARAQETGHAAASAAAYTNFISGPDVGRLLALYLVASQEADDNAVLEAAAHVPEWAACRNEHGAVGSRWSEAAKGKHRNRWRKGTLVGAIIGEGGAPIAADRVPTRMFPQNV